MLKRNLISIALVSCVFGAPLSDAILNTEFASVQAEEVKTKRVPALRNKVYTQLARAQKLADDGDVAAGIEALDIVKKKSSSMNSYEIAMMYNFYGFIYYNENRVSDAMAAFENVVKQDPIPESLKLNTIFSLAQLAMAEGQFDQVISYLNQWESLNTKPPQANYYELKANASYQVKDYKSAVQFINTAINLHDAENKDVKENWYVLLRASYYSLNKPKDVVRVLEEMVLRFDKPEYWVQLAGMYGEIGQDNKQLALIETAKQRGFLNDGTKLKNLAQIYMYSGLAYKAANAMELGFEQGNIEKSAKNLIFVAEAYMQAREDKKAVPYFIAAAKQTENGEYDRRLAEVYLNLELFDEAADSAREALDKGGLKQESNAYIALGMAQYNLENFDASILAFEQAKKFKKAERLAQQWLQYVKREKLDKDTLSKAYL
ncbi:tetratricopeptide repeat protein [Pseudoalteromonas piratica]|nr:tetratricopeptide repeat protein [Pseudoalteromonas piratica]